MTEACVFSFVWAFHFSTLGDWSVERPLELEDVQFLIKNASRLFPPDPSNIRGRDVRNAVWSLQDELIAEREVH